MDPALLNALLAGLQAIPSLIAAGEKIREIGSLADQAAVDAALDAAKAACLNDVGKAISDLDEAAKS